MNDDRRLERNSPPKNNDCDHGLYTSILVQCLKPDAITSDAIKSYFQKRENGGSCDVDGIIYPFRGNEKQAAVIFQSPESARRVYSKSHAEYTVKPLKTVFSEVHATIDNQQWSLLESARDLIEYHVRDVTGAVEIVESDSVRTVVGTQLQIEEVDRFLVSIIENPLCAVQQHSAAEVAGVPSASAQDLTNQVVSNDGADAEHLLRTGATAGASSSQVHRVSSAVPSDVTFDKSSQSITLQCKHVPSGAEAVMEEACGSTPVLLPVTLFHHLQGLSSLEYPHLKALLNDRESQAVVQLKNPSRDLIAKASSELESFVTKLTCLAHREQHRDMLALPQHCFESCGTTVRVYEGDLTKINVNAIVNPANNKLSNGAGAALAIAEAAGKDFDKRCQSYIIQHAELPTGNAIGFPASGRLLQCGIKHIINCVGPMYFDYSDDYTCREVLSMTVLNCLREADALQCASVAMPAISSGIYYVPPPICTAAYFDGVSSFLSMKRPQYVRDIHFVDLSERMCNAIREEFSRRQPIFRQGIESRNPETHSMTSSTSYSDGKADRWWGSDNSKQEAGSPNPSAAYNGRDARSTSSSAVAMALPTAAQIATPSLALETAESVTRSWSYAADPSLVSAPTTSAASAAEARRSHIVTETKPPLHADTVDSLPRLDDPKCPICLDIARDAKTLPCLHTFCSACVNNPSVQSSALCPVCRVPFGISQGNQPPGGTMRTKNLSRSLAGFNSFGTIEIYYSIPSGVQNASHPNPGRRYSGTTRTAYLPNNSEGQNVLRLLTDAFNRGLTFTIGTSHTTGQKDCVVWNDIHHKTAMDGGPTCFGYPDPEYLKRVKEELAAKGVI